MMTSLSQLTGWKSPNILKFLFHSLWIFKVKCLPKEANECSLKLSPSITCHWMTDSIRLPRLLGRSPTQVLLSEQTYVCTVLGVRTWLESHWPISSCLQSWAPPGDSGDNLFPPNSSLCSDHLHSLPQGPSSFIKGSSDTCSSGLPLCI